MKVLGDDVDGACPGPTGAKHLAPHAIPVSDVLGVDLEPWTNLGPLFWQRLVAEHLLHAHLMQAESVDKVQVLKAEATEPMVWQVRARVALAPGTLTLVPWAKAEPVLCENGEADIKRSAALHPTLRGHELVTATAQGDGESYIYAMRSPLDGKVRADAKVAAPFWCVIAAREGEDVDANMAYRECTLEVGSPALTVAGGRKNETNKSAKTKIFTKFRVLTNIRKIAAGEVLIVLPEAKAEGQNTKGEAAANTKAEPAVKRARRGA